MRALAAESVSRSLSQWSAAACRAPSVCLSQEWRSPPPLTSFRPASDSSTRTPPGCHRLKPRGVSVQPTAAPAFLSQDTTGFSRWSLTFNLQRPAPSSPRIPPASAGGVSASTYSGPHLLLRGYQRLQPVESQLQPTAARTFFSEDTTGFSRV